MLERYWLEQIERLVEEKNVENIEKLLVLKHKTQA
ncbi:hypothetical protein BH10CYA1_BH10CYA1_45560 [soil metagenome]